MANADPSPEKETETPENGAAMPDWRAGIDDEKVREFANRHASPADLAKTAFEFRQKLSTAISIPGKGASPSETLEFHRKLGVPDAPDGYAFEMPEGRQMGDGDKAFHASMAGILHKAGVTAEQAAALNAGWNEWSEAVAGDKARQLTQRRADAMAALRREWGGDYEANSAHAERAARAFGGDRFAEFVETAEIDGTKLGNHPDFIRVFATVGRRMGEGTVDLGPSETMGRTLEDRHGELTKAIHEAHAKGNSATANRLMAERKTVSSRLAGNAPIADAEGRSTLR